MHGLTGGGWKRSDLATVTAVKRPAGETRGKLAAGPNIRQRHRASPRPYMLLVAGSPCSPREFLASQTALDFEYSLPPAVTESA